VLGTNISVQLTVEEGVANRMDAVSQLLEVRTSAPAMAAAGGAPLTVAESQHNPPLNFV